MLFRGNCGNGAVDQREDRLQPNPAADMLARTTTITLKGGLTTCHPHDARV
jgi:hypothetical protein